MPIGPISLYQDTTNTSYRILCHKGTSHRQGRTAPSAGATGTRAAHTQLKPRRQGNPPAPVTSPRNRSAVALGRNIQSKTLVQNIVQEIQVDAMVRQADANRIKSRRLLLPFMTSGWCKYRKDVMPGQCTRRPVATLCNKARTGAQNESGCLRNALISEQACSIS